MNLRNVTCWVTILAMGILLLQCKSEPKVEEAPKVVKELKIPAFNRDSAYVYVQSQVDFGYRHMGSPGHEDCKAWIVRKLNTFGVTTIQQEFTAELFDGSRHPATNIIGKINPQNLNRIVCWRLIGTVGKWRKKIRILPNVISQF